MLRNAILLLFCWNVLCQIASIDEKPVRNNGPLVVVKPCEEEICYFSSIRKTNYETKPRPEKSVVSLGCSDELISFGDLLGRPINSETGETNAVALLLCRGAGICDLDFTKPEVVENWKNIAVCRHHVAELLEEWQESFRTVHIYRNTKLVSGDDRVCSIPDGIGIKHKPRTGPPHLTTLTIAQADLIIKKMGVLVHPGIPICRHHEKVIMELKPLPSASPVKRVLCQPGFYADTDDSTCSKDKDYQGPTVVKKRRTQSGFALRKFAEFLRLDKICFPNKPYSQLSPRYQTRKACAVKKMYDEMLKTVAEEDYEVLKKKVALKLDEDESWSTGSSQNFEQMMDHISAQFLAAEDRRSKTRILSIIADVVPFKTVLKYIPNLSRHLFRSAKIMARQNKKRDFSEPKKVNEAYNREALQFFIDFITSPTIMIGLPYGLRKVKTPDGKKYEIPNTIRQQSHTEIYDMYMNLLESTGRDKTKSLSRSSVFRILDVCAATKRTATTCVDYFTANGMEGFDGLHEIINVWIHEDLVHVDVLKQLKTELFEAAQYLRTDYRLHIKKCSRVPDHCATFALSDPSDKSLSSSCSSQTYEHKYDLRCDRCERANTVLDEIKSHSTDFIEEAEQLLKEDAVAKEVVEKRREERDLIEKYIGDIAELKKHYLRAAYTSQEREEIIEKLNDNEGLITLDFAQKYLPRWHRERQSDYFGKKGISYHISHIVARVAGNYVQHSFVHIYDSEVTQDSKIVVLTLAHVLNELKKVGISRVSLRSDNAGSYHCATTINSMHWLMKHTGVSISSYSFSEAQNGKSSSDRDASRVKRKAENYVAKGNDITTPEQFFQALKEDKMLNGMSIHFGSVTVTKPGNPIWKGISKLNYFTVEPGGIRGRRYSNIGEGHLFAKNALNSMEGNSKFAEAGFVASGIGSIDEERNRVLKNMPSKFWYFPDCENNKKSSLGGCVAEQDDVLPEIDEEMITTTENEERKLFSCPEPGCSSLFLTHWNLEKHILRGKHKISPQKLTLRDAALQLFVRNLEEVEITRSCPVIADALNEMRETTDALKLNVGWALPVKQTRKPFEPHVKEYLVKCFNEGLTNKRLDPRTVEKRMRTEKNNDGSLKFTVGERKDFRQIAGFFSREAEKRRSSQRHHHRRRRAHHHHHGHRHHHRRHRRNRNSENEIYIVPEEEHEDAGWLAFLKDASFFTEWDEIFQAVLDSVEPLFRFT